MSTDVLAGTARWAIEHERAETLLAALPDRSVDLVLVDPPYWSTGKAEVGDKQWRTADAFIAWIDALCAQYARVLKPNGSLYLCASPQMAAHVECAVAKRFNVLNQIVWVKTQGWHHKTEKEVLRSYLSPTERIIFAEQYGADSMAMGEAGYAAQCEKLHGFVFEPLRAYLASEREKAGWTTRGVAEAFQRRTGSRTVTGMAGHWFERVQWRLPTAENYAWLQRLFNSDGGAEYLRRDYEDLRRDYEDLRRPFSVSADVAYTDVWDFPTVAWYPGKHPAEKPQALLRHIITASSRPDAVVLDTFSGSGSTGVAALALGRRFIGCDMNAEWAEYGRARLQAPQHAIVTQLPLLTSIDEEAAS